MTRTQDARILDSCLLLALGRRRHGEDMMRNEQPPPPLFALAPVPIPVVLQTSSKASLRALEKKKLPECNFSRGFIGHPSRQGVEGSGGCDCWLWFQVMLLRVSLAGVASFTCWCCKFHLLLLQVPLALLLLQVPLALLLLQVPLALLLLQVPLALLLLQVPLAAVASSTCCCCKFHLLLLQVPLAAVASSTCCCCKFHLLPLRVPLAAIASSTCHWWSRLGRSTCWMRAWMIRHPSVCQ